LLVSAPRRSLVARALVLAMVATWIAPPAVDEWIATPAAGPKLEAGVFLVARRGLPDSNFTETVLLLLSYGPGGALGLVLNRPSDVELSVLTPRISDFADRDDPLYIGGPVPGDELFVLVRDDAPPDGAERVFGGVWASHDPEFLRRVAREGVPRDRLRVYAGYAGWAPGQLDRELERGDWHVVVPDEQTIFAPRPVETWKKLLPPIPTEQAGARWPGLEVGMASRPEAPDPAPAGEIGARLI